MGGATRALLWQFPRGFDSKLPVRADSLGPGATTAESSHPEGLSSGEQRRAPQGRRAGKVSTSGRCMSHLAIHGDSVKKGGHVCKGSEGRDWLKGRTKAWALARDRSLWVRVSRAGSLGLGS